MGEVDYLDILLNSNNLSEFLSSYYVITEIAEADKELLDDISEKEKKYHLQKKR